MGEGGEILWCEGRVIGRLRHSIISRSANPPPRLPLWVKSGNAHNEPMMSAFHPIATEQRTQFYVGSVPQAHIRRPVTKLPACDVGRAHDRPPFLGLGLLLLAQRVGRLLA